MPVTVQACRYPKQQSCFRSRKDIDEYPRSIAGLWQGRAAETATDPAPLEMFETVINLKSESEWREGMDMVKLKNEINDALSIPGFPLHNHAHQGPY